MKSIAGKILSIFYYKNRFAIMESLHPDGRTSTLTIPFEVADTLLENFDHTAQCLTKQITFYKFNTPVCIPD